MVGGQLMDITLSPEEITEEDLHELILRKTGALIIASVKIGAILGEASTFQLDAMVEYGRNIGIAFQIRDDILDSIGEEKENQSRPSYISFYGREEAENRLKRYIADGIRAFDKTSLQSEELRYLAHRLLSLNRNKK
jgi:geranylgeranyl diphosphate synthase type II